MSNTKHLADLISKRTGAGGTPTEQARILIDVERYRELRPEWESANKRVAQLARRQEAIEANPEFTKATRRKMNDPATNPVEEAAAELAAAEAHADELRAEVQACFVVVTVRGLRTDELATIRAKHPDPVEQANVHLRTAIVSVTDVDGNKLEGVTPSAFAKFIANNAVGDEERIWLAINTANASVDFPM